MAGGVEMAKEVLDSRQIDVMQSREVRKDVYTASHERVCADAPAAR